MENLTKFIRSLSILLLLLLYNSFSWGFVAFKAYNWFVLPNIALPNYTISQFVGFVLFIGVIMPIVYTHIDEKYLKDKTFRYTISFISPWLSLITCWIVSYFI